MADRLSVGVVGCGTVAQIMYLPYLQDLRDKFFVRAICDVSKGLVAAMQDTFNIESGFTRIEDLLNTDIDTVIILTPYHTEQVIQAAQAGKHVLVEKPMCFNTLEADRIIDAMEQSRIKLLVGYMKQYDPGYRFGVERMRKVADIKFIRSHNFPHDNNHLISDLYHIDVFDDVPRSIIDETNQQIRSAKIAALNTDDDVALEAYQMLLGVASHDISILRAAMGDPQQILFVDVWDQGSSVLANLSYGKNCRCVFEIARTRRKWFDEELTVYGSHETVSIRFPSPFLKNAATRVLVQEMQDNVIVNKSFVASYDEAFKRQLEHFHQSIIDDAQPLTTAYEAKQDIQTLSDIVKHYITHGP